MSHELRVPLSSVTMGVDLMVGASKRTRAKLQHATGDAARLDAYSTFANKINKTLGALSHASRSATALLEDIMDYS